MNAGLEFRFSILDAQRLAERKVGIPDWKAYRWRRMDEGAGPVFDSLVIGCVPNGAYSRGPRKGLPRFTPGVKGTRREVVVSASELIEQARIYVRDTGNCWDCKGSGQEYYGWSKATGARYRQCERCGGSGKDPAAEVHANG